MKYAAFKKDSNSRMIPLVECMLFDHEYQAQWFCIVNPSYTYKKINDVES